MLFEHFQDMIFLLWILENQKLDKFYIYIYGMTFKVMLNFGTWMWKKVLLMSLIFQSAWSVGTSVSDSHYSHYVANPLIGTALCISQILKNN